MSADTWAPAGFSQLGVLPSLVLPRTSAGIRTLGIRNFPRDLEYAGLDRFEDEAR